VIGAGHLLEQDLETTVREPNMSESRWSNWLAIPRQKVTCFPLYVIPRTLEKRIKPRDEILVRVQQNLLYESQNIRVSRNTHLHPNMVGKFSSFPYHEGLRSFGEKNKIKISKTKQGISSNKNPKPNCQPNYL